MKITYWSDYACPYCYIGETRLKKALQEMGMENTEIEMKAFQLDPDAGDHAVSDTQTRFAHKYGISLAEAGETIKHISEMGRSEGLDFRYASTLFTNTMNAHRLTKLAQSKNDSQLADKVTEALFKAYFTENKELADKTLLQKIGEECGLNPDEVKTVLASDQYKEDVLLDEHEAARCGIHAVPFFIIGKYGISGAQSVSGMKAAITKVMKEAAEMKQAQGMASGIDGCGIR